MTSSQNWTQIPPSQRPRRTNEEVMTSVKIPLLPPEVYYKVTQYLSLDTLKILRLSSHSFNDLVTSTLLKRGSPLNIAYHKSLQKFLPYRPKNGEDSLQNLTTLIKNSAKIPFNKLNLTHVPFLSEEIIQFFHHHGPILKSLKLTIFSGQSRLHQEISTILQSCPHLEKLELWNMDVRDDDVTILEQPLQFKCQIPALKYLTLFRYTDYTELVKLILQGSPKLEKCDQMDHSGLALGFLNLLVETNKVHTVQQIKINSPLLDPYDLLCKFQPKLKSLAINLDQIQTQGGVHKRIEGILSKLLKSSGETLEKIQIESPLGFLHVTWPTLNKCHSLLMEINNFSEKQEIIFQCGFDWNIFPSLRNVTLDFWYLDEITIGGIFPLEGVSESVHNLRILCRNYHRETPYPVSWFQGLGKLFPRVRNLHVKLSPNFFGTIVQVFGGKKLEKLIVEIVTHCPRFGLDMVLTGLSESECENFGGNKCKGFQGEGNSPIEKFKGLRTLEIIFGSDQRWRETMSDNFVLTRVSFFKAFQHMSEMRVKIIVRSNEIEMVEKSFESIKPYVNLQIVGT